MNSINKRLSRKYWTLAICLTGLLVLTANLGAASPDFVEIEATFRGSSTDNVSKNWRLGNDSFGGLGLTARVYPVSFAEFSATTEYTWYRGQDNLSNLLYRFSFSVIPTSQGSPTAVYLTGDLTGRDYKDLKQSSAAASNANEFTSKDYRLMAALGHRLNERLRLRTGYEMKLTGYDTDLVEDRYDHGLFVGANLSLPIKGSLDFEIGYEFGDYQYLPDTGSFDYYGILPQYVYSVLHDGTQRSWYISPRLSKSITARTGISLTVSSRRFIDPDEEAIVYGNSAQRVIDGNVEGVISPWASLYEGEYYGVRLTTHDLPAIKVVAAYGYWDKSFLMTLDPVEKNPFGEWEVLPVITTRFVKDGRGDRKDQMRRANLTVSLPLNMHTYFIEPSLTLDYTDNNSSIIVYDYDDFSLSMECRLRW